MCHCKKLTRKTKEQLSDMMDVERSKGMKALSRKRRERLEAYQHLFYLLQVSFFFTDGSTWRAICRILFAREDEDHFFIIPVICLFTREGVEVLPTYLSEPEQNRIR